MLFLIYLCSFGASYQLLLWKSLRWSFFLQLLNVTHRCYHATFTFSNGVEHGLASPPTLQFYFFLPNSSPMGDEVMHLGLLTHLIDFLPHGLGGGLQCSFTVKWLILIYSRCAIIAAELERGNLSNLFHHVLERGV